MVFIPVQICHKLVQKQQVSNCEKCTFLHTSYSKNILYRCADRYSRTVNTEFADQKTYFDWK